MLESIENVVKSNIENDEESDVKQCLFDRKGFCKAQSNCKFFHAENICEIYLTNKVCWKVKCRKRHPKVCRYFTRGNCYRGETCSYLHETNDNSCNCCGHIPTNRYYCEFCDRNFCSNCTVEEAHSLNIYNIISKSPSCKYVYK